MEQSDRKKHQGKDPIQKPQKGNDNRDIRKDDEDVCVKAPEWAEHQRFSDDDQPCDDGRSGRH